MNKQQYTVSITVSRDWRQRRLTFSGPRRGVRPVVLSTTRAAMAREIREARKSGTRTVTKVATGYCIIGENHLQYNRI